MLLISTCLPYTMVDEWMQVDRHVVISLHDPIVIVTWRRQQHGRLPFDRLSIHHCHIPIGCKRLASCPIPPAAIVLLAGMQWLLYPILSSCTHFLVKDTLHSVWDNQPSSFLLLKMVSHPLVPLTLPPNTLCVDSILQIVEGISSLQKYCPPHLSSQLTGQNMHEGKLYFFAPASQTVSWIDHVCKWMASCRSHNFGQFGLFVRQ